MFWRGMVETLAIVVSFVAFGLAWAAAAERAAPAGPAYPGPPMATSDDRPGTWLVDGFNVLHAGPLGGRDRAQWWTEPRSDEILAIADRFEDPAAEIFVVFDGPNEPDGDACVGRRLHRIFAPSADDWLLARVRAADDPTGVAVVTADRKVADRARHRGALVCTPRAFLERCSS